MKSTSIKTTKFVLTIILTFSMVYAEAGPASAVMDIAQTLSDDAQRNTIAFDGFGIITGTFEAQTFFPPGKVADYWGFQYLRDNTSNGNGHNTSFLTNCAYNVLYILSTEQFAALKTLASSQVDQINRYGYKRFPLMKAFRRQLDGDIPAGSTGLSLEAVKSASSDLYKLDGQICFDRAVVYADIYRTMSNAQKAHLDAMKAGGFDSWRVSSQMEAAVKNLMRGVTQDVSVALMTYASDLFSWYAGSVDADVYFCPERQGTYFGSFYIKDAPAIGHEGYKIDEALTANAGKYFLDQLATTHLDSLVTALVDNQRNNLYAGTDNIVQIRTDISKLLRSLISASVPTDGFKAQILAQVLEKSGTYGELDGEIVYAYTMAFTQVYKSMNTSQKTNLAAMRKKIMSGTYNGEPFDFSVCTTPYLYSAVIKDVSTLSPYISNTDYMFGVSVSTACSATIDGNSLLHIPYLSYIDPKSGPISLWADFVYEFNSKYPTLILFKYKNSGILSNPTFSCAASTLSNDLTIHIPDVLLPDGSTHNWLNMKYDPALSTGGSAFFLVTGYTNSPDGAFSLTSAVGVDGGTLPTEYTCDGTGSSPALSWSNPPAGTKEFALMMTTLPVDGTTKWNWVLYNIPVSTTSLAKNSSGVGILGTGSHGTTMAYDPPCSQGPGAKLYTFTLYALSESPQLPGAASQVTGDVLTKAIASITLGSASLNLSYTRP